MPRSLNRFQQLNAVKISGVATRPLDEALRYLEDEAAKILPKGYVLDYTGESRQLRTEGNTFIQAFGLARITSYNVCYTKLLRMDEASSPGDISPAWTNSCRIIICSPVRPKCLDR